MITRNLRAERLYKLSEYNSIRLSDEINDIPEHIASDKEVMNKLAFLLMLNNDYNFFEYCKLWKEGEFKIIDPESALEKLNTIIGDTVDDLGLIFKTNTEIKDESGT